MFIEGENLEVLKLLQKAYNDKVKLIYIDPPYNTGEEFIYNDDSATGSERIWSTRVSSMLTGIAHRPPPKSLAAGTAGGSR